jgi:hypothetical protein
MPRAWTTEDDRRLLELKAADTPLRQIAAELHRNRTGVETRLQQLGHAVQVRQPLADETICAACDEMILAGKTAVAISAALTERFGVIVKAWQVRGRSLRIQDQVRRKRAEDLAAAEAAAHAAAERAAKEPREVRCGDLVISVARREVPDTSVMKDGRFPRVHVSLPRISMGEAAAS